MNKMQKRKPTEQNIKEHCYVISPFTWERGSINDNIRKILIDKRISYSNTFNGDILVDLLNINLWEKVEYFFTDKERKNGLLYVK